MSTLQSIRTKPETDRVLGQSLRFEQEPVCKTTDFSTNWTVSISQSELDCKHKRIHVYLSLYTERNAFVITV